MIDAVKTFLIDVLGAHFGVMICAMIPIIELRGAIPVGIANDLNVFWLFPICIIGNMLPVPLIYFFARKVLIWGADKKVIGKIFTYCVEKGERGGQKLVAKTGRGGLFIALMLFVGIPIPGTGAWTGTLGASFLDMGFKTTVTAVCLGLILAGTIMGVGGEAVLHLFGM